MSKRIVKGVVIRKSKDNRSIVVRYARSFLHPVYGKVVTRHKAVCAESYGRDIGVGTEVSVQEIPPMSKTKTWGVI